ncbi:MAG: hypothetical protein OSB82_19395, partial [Alphaproteobacteria bacterium]|nr:hypothetical protein [Alphaproteobacteria bacterium]
RTAVYRRRVAVTQQDKWALPDGSIVGYGVVGISGHADKFGFVDLLRRHPNNPAHEPTQPG